MTDGATEFSLQRSSLAPLLARRRRWSSALDLLRACPKRDGHEKYRCETGQAPNLPRLQPSKSFSTTSNPDRALRLRPTAQPKSP